MKKIKLSLGEIIGLESEISGLSNQQTGEVLLKGLLSENINLVIKYRLSKLAEQIASDKKVVEGLREELIKKHGEEKDGNIFIAPFLDEANTIQNPNWTLFVNEYNKLLAEQKEIEHPVITLEDIKDVKSEGRYAVFFKLVEGEPVVETPGIEEV